MIPLSFSVGDEESECTKKTGKLGASWLFYHDDNRIVYAREIKTPIGSCPPPICPFVSLTLSLNSRSHFLHGQSLFKPSLLATKEGGAVLATNHVSSVDCAEWVESLSRSGIVCRLPRMRNIKECLDIRCTISERANAV